MNCEYCGQRVERVIRVGDLVQRNTGNVGLVRRVIVPTLVEVRVLGDRSGTDKLWYTGDLDLIHGMLHVTERV